MKNLTLFALVVSALLFTTGCEKKTPDEKAADSIKKAAHDTADALTSTAKKAEKSLKDAVK